jgi:RecA-family ATPase
MKAMPDTPTAMEMAGLEMPAIKFVVNNMIPTVSLSVMMGPPKSGKSMLALNMGSAVAKASPFLGSVSTTGRGVLYISLEDSFRRLKDRFSKMSNGSDLPENLWFAEKWEGAAGNQFQLLDLWLKMHNGVGLVIIDVLAKFRSIDQKSGYAGDYGMATRLRDIAVEHSVAIVILHHTVKNTPRDWVSGAYGSSGLTGASDTLMFLDRDRSSEKAKLHVTGRDVDDQAIDLAFDRETCIWKAVKLKDMLTTKEKNLLERFRNNPDDF